MKVEAFFKEKKGIAAQAAFKYGAKYSVVDMIMFAEAFAAQLQDKGETAKEENTVVKLCNHHMHDVFGCHFEGKRKCEGCEYQRSPNQ